MYLRISANQTMTNLIDIGGIRSSSFILKNHYTENNKLAQGRWNHLIELSGRSSIEIDGEGVFTNQHSEILFRRLAFQNKIIYAQILFDNLDHLFGPFLISSYQRMGDIKEEYFHLSLISAGEIIYIGNENNARAIGM